MCMHTERVSRWRLVLAVVIGVALPLGRRAIHGIWPSLPVVYGAPAMVLGYLIALAFVARPYEQYGSVLKLALGGSCGMGLHALKALLTFNRVNWGRYWLVPIVLTPILLGVTFLVTGLVLCGTLHMRRRLFPRIPSGHCQRCGYSLFGLPEDRCPECGTRFDRATGKPVQPVAESVGEEQGTRRNNGHGFDSVRKQA